MIQAEEYFVPFVKKVKVAEHTFSFYFDRKGIDYDFLPGQYNRITLPIIPTDGKGASRFFTAAASPLEKNYIIVTTMRGKSDFKKALFSLKQGEKIKLFGPHGGFVLDALINHQVYLSGGIGITPFYSMIQHVNTVRLPVSITLLAAFSNVEDVLYYDELISSTAGNISVIYTVSGNHRNGNFEQGRISEKLIRKYIPNLSKQTFFIAGSTDMIAATEEILGKLGIEDGKIKTDPFTGY